MNPAAMMNPATPDTRPRKRAGGRSPRRKGSGYEREIVNAAESVGLVAERAYASNGRALGEAEAVDVLISGCRIQAKRRAAIAQWLTPPDGADAVAVRADRGGSLIVFRFDAFLSLLQRADGW